MLLPLDPLARRLLTPALLLVAVLIYGVGGYMVLEDWSFLDALYMTVITLTTVGFQEVQPLDESGKAFTVSLMVMGVTLLLVTLTLVAVWVSEGTVGDRRRRRAMQREIDRMKDHFIVCAFGRVGRTIVRQLKEEDARLVVIDSAEHLEERLQAAEVPYLIGDPSSEETLRDAGVERARGLICAVDSDSTNVFITLMAKTLNPDIFVVARAAASESVPRLEQAGADRVISPYVTSGEQMALMAMRPGVVGSLDVERTDGEEVRVEEIAVEEGSALVGMSAGEACGRAVLLMIRHADGRVTGTPRRNQKLREGDRMILLGDEEALRSVAQA